MTSKIGSGGIDNRPVQAGSDRAVKRSSDATASASTQAPKAEAAVDSSKGVNITDSARQLAALEQVISQLPDVNEAKVSKLRAAIAAGTYEVSPDRIAEKLLRLEHELR